MSHKFKKMQPEQQKLDRQKRYRLLPYWLVLFCKKVGIDKVREGFGRERERERERGRERERERGKKEERNEKRG